MGSKTLGGKLLRNYEQEDGKNLRLPSGTGSFHYRFKRARENGNRA